MGVELSTLKNRIERARRAKAMGLRGDIHIDADDMAELLGRLIRICDEERFKFISALVEVDRQMTKCGADIKWLVDQVRGTPISLPTPSKPSIQ